MNKRQAIFLIIPFVLLTFGFGIASIIIKDKSVSYYEDRTLASRPKLSGLLNYKFPTDFEDYWVDQFAARDFFLKMYTYEQILTNKSLIRDVYVSSDGYMIQNTKAESDKIIRGYADEINALSDILKKDGKAIYYAPVGYSSSQLAHKLPQYLCDDQGEYNRSRLKSQLKNIKVIDVASYFKTTFTNEQKDKMFFKTDPHWNSDGAYQAFKYIINSMVKDGTLPQSATIKDSDFEFVEGEKTKFEGSFNKRMQFVYDMYEVIPYVNYIKNNMDMHLYVETNGKFNEEKLADFYATTKKNKTSSYNGAYAKGLPYIKIVNNDALTDKVLLVSRDSYYCAMTLMFPIVFKEVRVVDLRVYDNAKFIDIAKDPKIDVVMLENSDLTFRNNAVFSYGALAKEK